MRSFLGRIAFFVLSALVFLGTARGQDLPGVRARSFGGAYRAVATANDTIYYNPAGLIKYQRIALDVDYLVNVNSQIHQVSTSVIDSNTTSWGLGLAYNGRFGSNERRHTSHLFNLAIAMPLVKELLFLGSSIYYTYDRSALDSSHRHFFNLDLGLMACLPIGLSFAVVLDHIINPKAHEKGMGLSVATAYNVADSLQAIPLTLSVDWLMNDLKSKGNLDHVISGGAEYVFFHVLPLRLGLMSKLKHGDNLISLGTGLIMGNFAIDGLYQQHLSIGKIRNFGLALRINF